MAHSRRDQAFECPRRVVIFTTTITATTIITTTMTPRPQTALRGGGSVLPIRMKNWSFPGLAFAAGVGASAIGHEPLHS